MHFKVVISPKQLIIFKGMVNLLQSIFLNYKKKVSKTRSFGDDLALWVLFKALTMSLFLTSCGNYLCLNSNTGGLLVIERPNYSLLLNLKTVTKSGN